MESRTVSALPDLLHNQPQPLADRLGKRAVVQPPIVHWTSLPRGRPRRSVDHTSDIPTTTMANMHTPPSSTGRSSCRCSAAAATRLHRRSGLRAQASGRMATDIPISVSVFGCRAGSSPDLDDQSTAETRHDRPILPFVQGDQRFTACDTGVLRSPATSGHPLAWANAWEAYGDHRDGGFNSADGPDRAACHSSAIARGRRTPRALIPPAMRQDHSAGQPPTE